jgi:ankyrin repeat protein
MLKLLLESGADPNVTDERDKTPLHFAAQEGYADAAQVLIDAGAQVNARGRPGNTPLHDASVTGYLNAVKVLLAAGADVNVQDDRRRTPLHEAARKGRVELANFLVDAGARADIGDQLGQTPSTRRRPRTSGEWQSCSSGTVTTRHTAMGRALTPPQPLRSSFERFGSPAVLRRR